MAWRCSASSNHALVVNLRNAGIVKDDRILKAMMQVDRGHYVPRSGDPYEDSPQPIGYNATISAPHMHAMCLEELKDQLKPGAVVLDVGSGSGYLSAVMAELVRPDGRVYGIEHIGELVDMAIRNVNAGNPDLLRDGLVEFVVGDGRLGMKDKAPFDCIHVGAAAPTVPHELIAQLKNNGRLIVPVGASWAGQELMAYDKDSNGRVTSKSFSAVRYVPLTSREGQLNL
ncbi:hypothetical protein PBRA_005190 [Plasmodiophora brassicae]|nr:hypothetical protein PBRA_005190 [Plasmodiophora brassicae]